MPTLFITVVSDRDVIQEFSIYVTKQEAKVKFDAAIRGLQEAK